MALSDKLSEALGARSDVERLAEIAPYHVFRLKGPGSALRRAACLRARARLARALARQGLSLVHAQAAIAGAARVHATTRASRRWKRTPGFRRPPCRCRRAPRRSAVLGDEEIRIHTNRPGHPLLVKVSWHPRWRAEGADGPFLVSPALMLVIPKQPDVRLVYSRNWADNVGAAGTLGGLALCLVSFRRRRAINGSAVEDTRGLRSAGRAAPLGRSRAGRAAASARCGSPRERRKARSRAAARRALREGLEGLRRRPLRRRGRILPRGRRARPPRTTGCARSWVALQGESLLRLGSGRRGARGLRRDLRNRPLRTARGTSTLRLGGGAHEARATRPRPTAQKQRLLHDFPSTPWARKLAPAGPQSAPN